MSVMAGIVPVVSNEERIVSLINEIEECSSASKTGPLNFTELHRHILELEKFAFSFDEDEIGVSTVLECLAPEVLSRLNTAYCKWETELEYRFAHRLIEGKVEISEYLLYERFDKLVRRELSLVQSHPPKQILFIGSGPFPISAIHMHFQTGKRVDCVDSNREAVEISRQVMKKAGLTDSVRMFWDRGEEYSPADYDLVLVALLAKPKRAILKHLRKSLKPGSRILCRTSMGMRTLVYAPTVGRDAHGFHTSGKQIAEGEQTISTWLLEKAANLAAGIQMRWVTELDDLTAIQILDVMNRVLKDESTIGFPGPIDRAAGLGLMRQLAEDVKAGRRHVLVAQKGDATVGQLILTPNPLPNCRHVVEISRGIIDPSFRGAGLALRAFHEVATKCEQLEREVIWLDVREGTLAAMWWRHFGFEPFGLLHDYARVGDKTYSGIYMTQTTASLKERLTVLDRQAQNSAANGKDNGH